MPKTIKKKIISSSLFDKKFLGKISESIHSLPDKKSNYKHIKIAVIILTFALCVGIIYFQGNIYRFYLSRHQKDDATIIYHKNDNLYFKTTNDFEVNSEDEFRNIYFTALNNHWESVKFVCNNKYKNCIDDFEDTINDSVLMNALNDYVHPFHQYQTISYNAVRNVVELRIKYLYSEDDIAFVNRYVKLLELSTVEQINNYIINNISYELGNSNLVNLVKNKSGNCKGIADFENVLLYNINRPSYTISNDVHAWNVILENGRELHIDSTWNMKANNFYFKLTTDALKFLNDSYHQIPSVYEEFYN